MNAGKKRKRVNVFGFFAKIITLFFLLLVFLFPSLTEAEKIDLYDLKVWITDKRAQASDDIEQDLLEWPQTKWGRCTGVIDYIGRLGQEFTNLCGAVIQENAAKLGPCAENLTSTRGVLNTAKKCADTVGELAGAWGNRSGIVGSLLKCTLTSYIVANDMTVQQRDDWRTFINGLDDLNSLFSLSEVFQAGDIGALSEVSVPQSTADIIQLSTKIEKAKKDLEGRADKIKKVPGHMGSLKNAMLTIPIFKNDYFRDRRNAAVEALNQCRIEEAMDIYTMTQMQVIRQIGSLRAAVVLEEEKFYCTALKNRFSIMNEYEQGKVLQGVGMPYGTRLNHLNWANRDQMEALGLYKKLINDPELSDSAFARMNKELEAETARIKPMVEAANACIQSCGKRVTIKPTPTIPLAPVTLPPGVSQAVGSAVRESGPKKCTFSVTALMDLLASERNTICGQATQSTLDKLKKELDKTRMARNRSKDILEKYKTAIQSQLDTCDLNDEKIQAVKVQMEKERLLDQKAYGFPNASCYQDTVIDLDKQISERQRACGQLPDKLYFIISIQGTGFTQMWGPVHTRSGMHEEEIVLEKPLDWQHLREELQRKHDELIGDVCERLDPTNCPCREPEIWNAGPLITVVDVSEKSFNGRKLKDTWKVTSENGPPLDGLKQGCKGKKSK